MQVFVLKFVLLLIHINMICVTYGEKMTDAVEFFMLLRKSKPRVISLDRNHVFH